MNVLGTFGKVTFDDPRGVVKTAIDQSEMQPFIREVFCLSLLNRLQGCDHVINMVDFDIPTRKIVLEAGCCTLAYYCNRQLREDADWGFGLQARRLLWQLLRGMQNVNTAGVYHRDLKPDNIVMTSNDELKIIDFGLARTGIYSSVTASTNVYTLWWRAPELLVADLLEIDSSFYDGTATEIYSVGTTYLCMLLGYDHGVLQRSSEEKQLSEILRAHGGMSALNTDMFDSHPHWRRIVAKKVRMHAYNDDQTLQSRLLHLNPQLPLDCLEILMGMLNPDHQQRWSYQKLCSHAFFDSVRLHGTPVAVTGPPSKLVTQLQRGAYESMIKKVCRSADKEDMSTCAKIFMLSLFHMSLEVGNADQHLSCVSYACLFIANIMYSFQPISLSDLFEQYGFSIPDLEREIDQVLRCVKRYPYSIDSACQLFKPSQDRDALLNCYYNKLKKGWFYCYTTTQITQEVLHPQHTVEPRF
jgi:serine/threonine protein kinase